MEGIKIVTIGGGSSYTPELVEGFIKRYEKLPVRGKGEIGDRRRPCTAHGQKGGTSHEGDSVI